MNMKRQQQKILMSKVTVKNVYCFIFEVGVAAPRGVCILLNYREIMRSTLYSILSLMICTFVI